MNASELGSLWTYFHANASIVQWLALVACVIWFVSWIIVGAVDRVGGAASGFRTYFVSIGSYLRGIRHKLDPVKSIVMPRIQELADLRLEGEGWVMKAERLLRQVAQFEEVPNARVAILDKLGSVVATAGSDLPPDDLYQYVNEICLVLSNQAKSTNQS